MSVFIKGIRFINWRCFKGEQEIDLEPTVYAVVARETANPDRSNWLGKSSFGEGPRFALTGELRKTEFADDFITRGESEGGVELELSDGTFISRMRKRGSSTRLEVERNGVTLVKEEAQEVIDRYTGGKEFYDLTSFFGQGKTDQYVKMTPGQRTDVVSEWLNLAPLQQAEAYVRKNELAKLETEQAMLTSRVQYLEAQHKSVSEIDSQLKQLTADLSDAEEAVKEARRELAEANARAHTRSQWQAAQRSRAQLQELRQRLAQVKPARNRSKVEGLEETALNNWTKCKEASNQNARETRAAEQLVLGDFDGRCPVAAGFACPAKVEINQRDEQNRTRLRQLQAQGSQLKEQTDLAKTNYDEAKEQFADFNKRAYTIASLTTQIETLEQLVEGFGKMPEPEQEEEVDYSIELETASRQHADISREIKTQKDVRKELSEAEPKLQLMRARGAVYRAACLVLGRTGAQRVMAEDALADIAGQANAVLKRAGVALSVTVSWARETNRLDEACRSCGFFFGKGQAVKSCPECKATRLPALDMRLTLDLSSESGGADNITGFVFQLSASKWLRAYRDRGLPSLFIDEPFGMVDRHNRLALAARLHSMLEQDFGVRQAFLVAHDADTLDTLPARIVITSEGGFSTMKAVI